MSIQEIRERINVVLYGSKGPVLSTLRVLNLLVSAAALVLMVSYYGFPHSSAQAQALVDGIRSAFGFYVAQYFIKLVYDFQPLSYLRRTWFEGTVMTLLLAEGISDLVSGELIVGRLLESVGIPVAAEIYSVFIQAYFIIVVGLELVRRSNVLPKVRLNPALIFILSFAGIIAIGTGLLMLPEMSRSPGGMPFLDALFTATSATCVTGLVTVDPALYFTVKGQWVILAMIQLGGINLISFGTLLMLVSRFGIGIKQHDVIEDFYHTETFIGGSGMMRKVLLYVFGIELLAAVGLYLTWSPEVDFAQAGPRWFVSLFHAVSGFNNAGISLFPGGLMAQGVATSWLAQWVLIGVMFAGALGLVPLFDLFDREKLRERMRQPWRQISFSSKIAIYFSLALVAVGAALFYLLESRGILRGSSTFGGLTTAVFQSVSARTTGFNTFDFHLVGVPMLLITCVLMTIGGSSSSTAGGIKTSTLAILLADLWRTIRGHEHPQLFKRRIPDLLIARAHGVVLFTIGAMLVLFIALSITEQHILAQPGRNVLDLMFEATSAFNTVGLSTGITAQLSDAGKVIIVLAMFIGRIGTLTIAFAIGGRLVANHFKYPEGHTMVG
jgi:Trk-type K+ transport system membrane component